MSASRVLPYERLGLFGPERGLVALLAGDGGLVRFPHNSDGLVGHLGGEADG